ncbi:MAG TPA: hypothetical protein PKM75_01330 [Prolixibacteraceae bacterium]|nr:hypothetical protein [Prolixibacteraceae bacterium]
MDNENRFIQESSSGGPASCGGHSQGAAMIPQKENRNLQEEDEK